LSRINPSRIAAFNAERNVARIRCNVDGDGSRPRLFGVEARVANIAASHRRAGQRPWPGTPDDGGAAPPPDLADEFSDKPERTAESGVLGKWPATKRRRAHFRWSWLCECRS
jgi:hypothetical protein